jgi:flagellar motor switch protein FliN/FliY
MNDEVKPDEEAVSEDDWAAAMGEQETVESDGAAEDDWAAAMGEQSVTEKSNIKQAEIFNPLTGGDQPSANHGFELILDIPVSMTVELGRTKISIRNLLQLAHGSVVELDGLAGEPMDVLVNGTLIAQGEVVVVNDKFGIRLTDIITPQERLRKLNK